MSPRLRVGLIIVTVIAFAAVMMLFLPTDAKFILYFITALGYASVISGVVAILIGFRAPRGDPLRLS